MKFYLWRSLQTLRKQVVVNAINPSGLHLFPTVINATRPMRKSISQLTFVCNCTFLIVKSAISLTISVYIWSFVPCSVLRRVYCIFSIFLTVYKWTFISPPWFLKNSFIFQIVPLPWNLLLSLKVPSYIYSPSSASHFRVPFSLAPWRNFPSKMYWCPFS